MRSKLISGVLMCWLAMPSCVSAPQIAGPLSVRNQHPAQLTVMHMDPAGATVLAKGVQSLRTDQAYTSMFLYGDSVSSSWRMDGEVLRTALDTKIGLGSGLQLGVQIAAAHSTGGFLDGFLIDYHRAFGMPGQDRATNPRDEHSVIATQGGETVWSVDESSVELLDLPIHLVWQLREPREGHLGVALRGGVELPTGDQSRGYGNGEADYAIGGLLDYRSLGLGFSGHVQHTFAGTPSRARKAGFSFQDVTSVGLGVELPLRNTWSALIQAEWETSTLRGLGLEVASREQLTLWIGGRYQPSPTWSFEVAFGEDLIALSSADFTAWFACTWSPGGR